MRFFPETLVGRTVLVLLIGVVLSQVAPVVLFSLSHHELSVRMNSQQRAERIASAVQIMNRTDDVQRMEAQQALGDHDFHIGWGREPVVGLDEDLDGEGRELRAKLNNLLPGRELHVREGHSAPGMPAPGPGFVHPEGGEAPEIVVAVRLDDESWLNFIAHLQSPEPFFRPFFLVPLLCGLVVVLTLSVMAVRRAARPLALMEQAAQRLGRDVNAPPVPVSGPREVRAAATAFNEMQARLRRFIDDRTQMVAAISHDLRTPITRLKLRAEFIDDEEQQAKVLADLAEMEAMIASTLAFARDDAAREMREPMDLAALLAELCGEFGATYLGPDSLRITAGPLGMKRTFANLLGNAKKYANAAHLTLTLRDKGHVQVVVDDDGPGIPEVEMERVFAPFYRVEASRNRETGGTGLGLSVARSAVRAHGGDIALSNRAEGGLRVTVVLPV